MKEKIKTTSFWLGVGGAIVIILKSIIELFGFNVDLGVVENIIITVCSVFVMLGIITKKSDSDQGNTSKDELIAEIENFKTDDK